MDLDQILERIEKDSEYNFIKKSIRIVNQSLDLYDWENLAICFNGGKDAQAALHLVRLAIYKKKFNEEQNKKELEQNLLKGMKVVYFADSKPLKEVDEFIEEHAAMYNFDLLKLGENFKTETKALVEKYKMKAIYLGTRRSDPFCAHLEFFSPSDTEKGWAPFMRINPLIDWTYEQTWKFLIDFKIPYCSLYDRGYTHLGNTENTTLNPYLCLENGEYLPAHQANGKYENFSRQKIPNIQQFINSDHYFLIYKKSHSHVLNLVKDLMILIGEGPTSIEILDFETFFKAQPDKYKDLSSKKVIIIYYKEDITKDDIEKVPISENCTLCELAEPI